jgi:hypothetical protein
MPLLHTSTRDRGADTRPRGDPRHHKRSRPFEAYFASWRVYHTLRIGVVEVGVSQEVEASSANYWRIGAPSPRSEMIAPYPYTQRTAVGTPFSHHSELLCLSFPFVVPEPPKVEHLPLASRRLVQESEGPRIF